MVVRWRWLRVVCGLLSFSSLLVVGLLILRVMCVIWFLMRRI